MRSGVNARAAVAQVEATSKDKPQQYANRVARRNIARDDELFCCNRTKGESEQRELQEEQYSGKERQQQVRISLTAQRCCHAFGKRQKVCRVSRCDLKL